MSAECHQSSRRFRMKNTTKWLWSTQEREKKWWMMSRVDFYHQFFSLGFFSSRMCFFYAIFPSAHFQLLKNISEQQKVKIDGRKTKELKNIKMKIKLHSIHDDDDTQNTMLYCWLLREKRISSLHTSHFHSFIKIDFFFVKVSFIDWSSAWWYCKFILFL